MTFYCPRSRRCGQTNCPKIHGKKSCLTFWTGHFPRLSLREVLLQGLLLKPRNRKQNTTPISFFSLFCSTDIVNLTSDDTDDLRPICKVKLNLKDMFWDQWIMRRVSLAHIHTIEFSYLSEWVCASGLTLYWRIKRDAKPIIIFKSISVFGLRSRIYLYRIAVGKASNSGSVDSGSI